MSKLKVKYLYNSAGQKTSVAVPGKVFEKLEEKLDDYYTYRIVNERRKKKEPTYSFEEVKRATNKRSK